MKHHFKEFNRKWICIITMALFVFGMMNTVNAWGYFEDMAGDDEYSIPTESFSSEEGTMISYKFEGDRTYNLYCVCIKPLFNRSESDFLDHGRADEIELHFSDGTIVKKNINYKQSYLSKTVIDLEKECPDGIIADSCTLKVTKMTEGSIKIPD